MCAKTAMLLAAIACLSATGASARADDKAAPAPVSTAATATESLRRLDFRVSPIAALFEMAEADLDIGILPSLTIGPSFGYLRGSSGITDTDYYQYGIVATYFFSGRRFTDGFYSRAMVYWLPSTIARTAGGTVFVGSQLSYAGGAVAGYEWMITGGLNFNLGVGATYYAYSGTVRATAPSGAARNVNSATNPGLEPTLEASLGYAF